jgi:hypothetical protein
LTPGPLERIVVAVRIQWVVVSGPRLSIRGDPFSKGVDMPYPRFPVSGLSLFALVLLTGCLCAVCPPAAANVTPEAVTYFNVMPAGDPQTWCTTNITNCSQMSMSTDQEGLIAFQIFIDPYSHYGEAVTHFTANFDWPAAWQFVDFAVCPDGTGSYDPPGLQLDWPCVPRNQMFLAATLVFNVHGYGRLSIRYDGQNRLLIGCPPNTYEVTPNHAWAEAGTTCEYTHQPCGAYGMFVCVPSGLADEMTLTAPSGGTAHGEDQFTTYPEEVDCHGAFHVVTGASWCSGWVRYTEYMQCFLMLDADATSLDPGTYQTWVQVYTTSAARCLDLIFEVEPATPVLNTSWGRVKATYR